MRSVNTVALKISFIYFIIVTAAVILIGAIALKTSQNAVLTQYEKQQKHIAYTLESNINLHIDHLSYRLENITLDSFINKVLRNEASDYDREHMHESLQTLLSNTDAVKSLKIYSRNAEQIDSPFIAPEAFAVQEPWYTKLHNQKSKVHIEYDDTAAESIIRMSSIIKNDRFGSYTDKIGIITLEIHPSAFISGIDPAVIIGLKEFFIIDDQLNVIFSNSRKDIGSILPEEDFLKDRKFFFEKNLKHYGWKLIGTGDPVLLNQSTEHIKRIIVFIVTSSVMIFFLVTMPFSNSLYKRIAVINMSIQNLGRIKISLKPKQRPYDEISEIEIKMLETEQQVYGLVDSLKQRLKKEEELKLKFLNSQINHLLLNTTLSNINWMALSKGIEKLSELSNLVAEFYRSTLSGKEKTIPLSEELKQIDFYMSIISIIYPDMITYTCDSDDAFLLSYTTKTILQPVFENSIIHGILPKNEKGQIRLKVFSQEDTLIITVSDNGMGFNADSVQKNLKRGVGLNSVNKRIQLIYGESYGLSVASRRGAGTTVTIRQPYICNSR